MRGIGIGIGAGLVSALLLAVGARAAPPAVVLLLLAPLPVLIVTLGWTHRAGLAAAGGGCLALGAAAGPMAGLGYLVWTGLPAWWLGYLALLGRPAADGSVEWYPLGRILAWVAVTAVVVLAAVVVLSGGGYEAYQAQARETAEMVLRRQTGTPRGAPLPQIGGLPPEALVDRLAGMVPLLVALSLTLVLSLLLWLAAKVVLWSGRLPRPWPFLPGTAMPQIVLLLVAAALGLAMLGGLPGALGLALLGALGAALALQGLALTHQRSMALHTRLPFLIGLYVMIALSQGAMLVPVALVGLADLIFGLRGGGAAQAGPHDPPPTNPQGDPPWK